MPRHGKRYRQAAEMVDAEAKLSLSDAVDQLVQFPPAKFDETVELHMRLGVDPTHQDQQVRGTLSLPHGTGRSIRVIAFATGDGAQEAREAGADEVGTDELAKRIQGGWLDFEAAVAMPDTMRIIGPLGRILGPRGLMPNARAGTVTNDVGRVINDLKGGRVEFRVERLANVHVRAGKVSMGAAALKENLAAIVDAIVQARPAAAKGTYLLSVTLTTTMGPGISMDVSRIHEEAAALAA